MVSSHHPLAWTQDDRWRSGWVSSNQLKASRAKTRVSREEEFRPWDCSISSCLSFQPGSPRHHVNQFLKIHLFVSLSPLGSVSAEAILWESHLLAEPSPPTPPPGWSSWCQLSAHDCSPEVSLAVKISCRVSPANLPASRTFRELIMTPQPQLSGAISVAKPLWGYNRCSLGVLCLKRSMFWVLLCCCCPEILNDFESGAPYFPLVSGLQIT